MDKLISRQRNYCSIVDSLVHSAVCSFWKLFAGRCMIQVAEHQMEVGRDGQSHALVLQAHTYSREQCVGPDLIV